MEVELARFLHAWSHILAVMLGGVLTFSSTYLIRRQDLRLKVTHEFITRRVDSYIALLDIVRQSVYTTTQKKADGTTLSFLSIFESTEHYTIWHQSFLNTLKTCFHLVDNETYTACQFFKHYLITLEHLVECSDIEISPETGRLLQGDFIMYERAISDKCLNFFARKAQSSRVQMELFSYKQVHDEEIIEKIKNTKLWQLRS